MPKLPKTPTPPKIEDLPAGLAALLADHMRTRQGRSVAFVSYQRFVDGRLVALTGDAENLPRENERISLSCSQTLSSHGTVKSITDLFVGRLERGSLKLVKPGSAAKPAPRATRKASKRRG